MATFFFKSPIVEHLGYFLSFVIYKQNHGEHHYNQIFVHISDFFLMVEP